MRAFTVRVRPFVQGELPECFDSSIGFIAVDASCADRQVVHGERPDETGRFEQHGRVVVEVEVANQFQMFVLVDLQVRHAKTFEMRVMNARLIDEIRSLLFDLAFPVVVDPTTPVILFVAVGQRTSDNGTVNARVKGEGTVSPVTRSGHCDLIAVVEEALNQTVVGVVVVDEERGRERTSVWVPQSGIENGAH